MNTSPSLSAFTSRRDLDAYGDNALLLFALALRWRLDDIRATAAQSLTDGSDDKKCDLVYIDEERRVAVIGQSYQSRVNRDAAPANKASDLNTAASWLLARDITHLPLRIRPAAEELRAALNSGLIDTLEFWYVHNLPESQNVKDELNTVVVTARSHLANLNPGTSYPDISAIEVGISTLDSWYLAHSAHILITDRLEVEVPGGYQLTSSHWKAFSTAVPASWLFKLYHQYGTQLFSANLRDYLGSRDSDTNINNGIKASTTENPQNLWAYNNGITALVNDFNFITDRSEQKLVIDGISIVNGAQTTGAIASVSQQPNSSAMVQTRFIVSSNQDVIQGIVRYNNSQNKIAPADFRSTDAVQERLRQEFSSYPDIVYLGGRRGGAEDAIRRAPEALSSDTVAQALAAFHGQPRIAYHRKAEIWIRDDLYSQLFKDDTHAEHIIFVYTLHLAVSNYRLTIMDKERRSEALTGPEEEALEFLRIRGAFHILMAAIGASMEIILTRAITNTFLLKFASISDVETMAASWLQAVEASVAFRDSLRPALGNRLLNRAEVDDGIRVFKSLMEATRQGNRIVYERFAKLVQ
jgi:AIPR protein